jgi:hypothetical protein
MRGRVWRAKIGAERNKAKLAALKARRSDAKAKKAAGSGGEGSR